jgi:glucokinase
MNNGQALALGEFGSFADKSITDLIVIRTGEGIGGGLIHNGEINHGNNYGAGEFGKISVAYDEARNEHVHLTTVATDEMILKRARKLARQDPNRPQRVSRFRCIEDICQAASKNDGVARQVIEETGRYFGRAICNLVSINSVRNIIVSGRISAMGKSLQTAIEDEVKKLGMSEVAKKTVIDIVPENPNTSLIGAATPLLTHAFGIPRFVPDRS